MVDLSVGNVLRLGSGLLFAALGAAVLVVGRRRVGALALGAHLLAAGTWIATVNLTEVSLLAGTVMSVGMWCLGLAASGLLPHPVSRRERPALWLTLAIPLLSAFPLGAYDPGRFSAPDGASLARVVMTTLLDVVNWTVSTATFLLPAFRLAFAGSVDRRRVAQAAGLSLPGALWVGSGLLPTMTWDPLLVAPFVVAMLVLAAEAGAWLVAAERGGGRAAVAVGWTILGTALAGYALGTFGRVVIGEDLYGFTGIARILGWAAAAIAVLRADLLGVPLPRIAVKRGTATTAVVASFFIAAEVSQNFLADEYGLLMGGVVAGALLFAASPIQRAMERLAERQASPPGGARGAPATGDLSRREDAYLNAVRLALRDRRLAREEERHLARLAEELGIGAGRAHEILVQAEREAEVMEPGP